MDSVLPSGPKSETDAGDNQDLTTQGSWWGLVGWRATSYTPSQAQDPPPTEPSDLESVAVAIDKASAETDILSSNTPAHEQAPHGSTLSAETPQGRGASWLASWPWYGQSTPTPAPGMVQPEDECADQVEVEKNTPKTAEAEGEVLREAPVEQGAASSTHVELANPIQSSITANIYGWTSFLSSRTLLAKRITDTEHREEDTMEVMVIDESDYERSSTVVTSEARAGKDAVAREARAVKQPPAPPRSPSPSPKPKAKPDDLKGTKRTSVSPAPSKSSGRASPRVPPPPNLVLPAWDDTFLTMPRSSVPRVQSDTALAKTVRFVSGMLWAKDDGASTGKGKARSTDDERFADFGGELPRIWDVIGERLDGDVLRGCKRVVVIGIHGWFPGTFPMTAVLLGLVRPRDVSGGIWLVLTSASEQVLSCGPYSGRFVLLYYRTGVLVTDPHVLQPTGTSSKFVTMMCQALEVFQEQHGVRIEKVTQIPLEGEGTISKRVDKCVQLQPFAYRNIIDSPVTEFFFFALFVDCTPT